MTASYGILPSCTTHIHIMNCPETNLQISYNKWGTVSYSTVELDYIFTSRGRPTRSKPLPVRPHVRREAQITKSMVSKLNKKPHDLDKLQLTFLHDDGAMLIPKITFSITGPPQYHLSKALCFQLAVPELDRHPSRLSNKFKWPPQKPNLRSTALCRMATTIVGGKFKLHTPTLGTRSYL